MFKSLSARKPTPQAKVFSADTVANLLGKLHLPGIHDALEEVITKAEHNVDRSIYSIFEHFNLEWKTRTLKLFTKRDITTGPQ